MPIWSAEIKELEKLYEFFIGQLPDLEKELGKLIKADDENMILLYSRRCLEVIITDLCECELKRHRKTEPLKGIIDKLNKEEKVPSNIITSMDHLNSLSAYGAHPKDFDPEQVKPVLVNLDIIIKWYLKYKESKINITSKSEEVKDEVLVSDDTAEKIEKSKKRLILLLSGLALVVAIVVVALFVFNIIGGRSRIEELEKSIAVLPFKNDSPDQERMYFINGTMEAILDNLCKIKDLRVPGRTSVEQYRDNLKPIPTIAKELDVNYILEGSGHRDGNNVRLHVQLIDARKDRHLWSKKYDAEIEEIFSMQSEIAKLVAEEIEAIITPEEKTLIEKIPTTSMTSYDYCLQGQEEVMKIMLGREYDNSLEQAAHYFKMALEYDPGYARAYAGLAMVKYYTNTSSTLTGGRQYAADDLRSRNLDSMNLLAEKALELDERIADAYYVKGYFEREQGNLAKAMEFMKQAIAIDPNNTRAMIGASNILWSQYDYVGSMEMLQRVSGLEGGPTLGLIFNTLAWEYWDLDLKEPCEHYLNEYVTLTGDSLVYYTLMFYFEFQRGRAEDGFKYAQAGYALDTTDQDATLIMGRAYLDLEQYEQAVPYYTRYFSGLENSGDLDVNDMNRMGYLLWMLGEKEEAQHYFQEMIAHCKRHIMMNTVYGRTSASFDIAGVYAFLGEKDSAYHYLEMFKQTNYQSAYIITMLQELDPLFEPIRREERFQKLVRQMEAKYQAEHERVRKWLEEQGML